MPDVRKTADGTSASVVVHRHFGGPREIPQPRKHYLPFHTFMVGSGEYNTQVSLAVKEASAIVEKRAALIMSSPDFPQHKVIETPKSILLTPKDLGLEHNAALGNLLNQDRLDWWSRRHLEDGNSIQPFPVGVVSDLRFCLKEQKPDEEVLWVMARPHRHESQEYLFYLKRGQTQREGVPLHLLCTCAVFPESVLHGNELLLYRLVENK